MKDEEWVEMGEKVASVIRLNLGDEIIHKHPKSKDRKGSLGKIRRSLYKKEFDKQVVREEATA